MKTSILPNGQLNRMNTLSTSSKAATPTPTSLSYNQDDCHEFQLIIKERKCK
jgi:hypothetical protein